MSAPLTSTRLALEDLQDAPPFMEKVCQIYNEHHDQVSERFKRSYTEAVFEQYDFKHATEKIIKVPAAFANEMPAGIEHVRCRGLEVDSSGKPTGKFYTLGIERMDWREIQRRPDDPAQVGVTVYFAAPPGIVNIRRNATQVVATATFTPIQFDTDEQSLPVSGTTATSGALSYDVTTTSGTPAVNSKITCRDAGFVRVHASAAFGSAGGTGVRHIWIQKNNDTTKRWGFYVSDASTARVGLPVSMVVPVSAGDYLQLEVYQASGGNITMDGGADNGPRFQAQYVEPARDTTGRVRLRFDKE